MAWEQVKLNVNGKDVSGMNKGNKVSVNADISPKVGQKFTMNGKSFIVESVEDYANRGQEYIITLKGQENGRSTDKSEQGRTKDQVG